MQALSEVRAEACLARIVRLLLHCEIPLLIVLRANEIRLRRRQASGEWRTGPWRSRLNTAGRHTEAPHAILGDLDRLLRGARLALGRLETAHPRGSALHRRVAIEELPSYVLQQRTLPHVRTRSHFPTYKQEKQTTAPLPARFFTSQNHTGHLHIHRDQPNTRGTQGAHMQTETHASRQAKQAANLDAAGRRTHARRCVVVRFCRPPSRTPTLHSTRMPTGCSAHAHAHQACTPSMRDGQLPSPHFRQALQSTPRGLI